MARPPSVLWTFHGTAAVPSYRKTLDWLRRFVGCVALEVSDAGPPVARYGGCCWLGDSQLELAQPNAPDTATVRFIERFGPGYLTLYRLPPVKSDEVALWYYAAGRPRFHLMTFRVKDLHAAEEIFLREGIRILRGSAGTGEIITHPQDTAALLMAWTDRDLPGDPRGPLTH